MADVVTANKEKEENEKCVTVQTGSVLWFVFYHNSFSDSVRRIQHNHTRKDTE